MCEAFRDAMYALFFFSFFHIFSIFARMFYILFKTALLKLIFIPNNVFSFDRINIVSNTIAFLKGVSLVLEKKDNLALHNFIPGGCKISLCPCLIMVIRFIILVLICQKIEKLYVIFIMMMIIICLTFDSIWRHIYIFDSPGKDWAMTVTVIITTTWIENIAN